MRRVFKAEGGLYELINTSATHVAIKRDAIWLSFLNPKIALPDYSGEGEDESIALPATAEVIKDLCDLFDVDDVSHIGRVKKCPFRVIAMDMDWDQSLDLKKRKWLGICHYFDQRHISLFDLWKDLDDISKGPVIRDRAAVDATK